MIGVGGEHAAVMAAFLDLPDPHKCPRQFYMIKKHLYKALEHGKECSQLTAANNEVPSILNDNNNVVEQIHLLEDIPLTRLEASFDMGWQVRSSGGKYGSSTGHSLLIGAPSKKVLDSAVFNKKCGLCKKHEQKTGTLTNI
jgi:hypothetical protein